MDESHQDTSLGGVGFNLTRTPGVGNSGDGGGDDDIGGDVNDG